MCSVNKIRILIKEVALIVPEQQTEGFEHLEDHNLGNRQSYGKSNNQTGFPHRNMNWRDVHMQHMHEDGWVPVSFNLCLPSNELF